VTTENSVRTNSDFNKSSNMAQVLPSKEATLFRHLVQNYETKQYKKGIKAAEQILRKHPNHGDTQAMKALILSNQGKSDEAFELCKLALKNAMKSHVCWHVYGLLYRGVRNYEEALKAYRFALRLDPDSTQIQRDLALLQMQMRDYAGLIQSRQQMLQAKPQQRSNWTALAIAQHLNGDLAAAEDILHRYEETLKQPPSKNDMEHQEAVLYKNTIIAESGDVQRALEQLDAFYKNAIDRVAVMELKAEYLLRLEKTDEAEKAYRALLNRNTERRAYFVGLEKARGLDRSKKDDQEKLVELYEEYASKSERRDAARRIPLDFLEGDAFREHADKYLRRMFKKGIPSTFANIKQLYADPAKKETIIELVEGYSTEELQANGGAEQHVANGGVDKPATTRKLSPETVVANWNLSVNYFLAQHYDYYLSRDVTMAKTYVEKAVSINTSKTDYTYHMTRARIMKHQGDTDAASKAMNEAREMDVKDRYINTKCAKYQLRNNEHQPAVDTMGLFTRKEAVGGPLGDLVDMQCVWFITEDGESYLREGNLALALKRFKSVHDIFDTWTDDQFDFHSFSLRKGMIRAYVDMVRWEDRLREHPFFSRAALSAVRILTLLHDRPELVKGGRMNGSTNSAADKKAAAKARKQAEKVEAEKKAAAAKKATPKAEDASEAKKEDQDPSGTEAFKTTAEKPLEEAMKYVEPLLELSPKSVDAQVAGFEVYIRRGKCLPYIIDDCPNMLTIDRRKIPACAEMPPRHPSHRLEKPSRPRTRQPPETCHQVITRRHITKSKGGSRQLLPIETRQPGHRQAQRRILLPTRGQRTTRPCRHPCTKSCRSRRQGEREERADFD
jgi:tetratricopeptide (TPR) repeat protein